MIGNFARFFTLLLLGIFLSACPSKNDGGGANPDILLCNGGDGIPTGDAEEAYCSAIPLISPSNPIQITGSAIYEYRNNGNEGAAGVTLPNRPIRRAEIQIKNSAGTLVQCGETDNSGNFSINMPSDGGNYTLAVRSRGDNSFFRASVLDTPAFNDVYELTATFNANATQSVGTLTASGRGEVLGAAFNILDQILKANEFLVAQTAGCSSLTGTYESTLNCAAFAVSSSAPKISAYWMKGFNPLCFFGESLAVSFYMPGDDQLFILGGIDGDVDSSDTDHFDNSIIIHEYGHFLEDNFAVTDNPGGFHNGNSVVDPRLAWSEGWAYFLQSAVLDSPLSIDTIGTAEGSGSTAFITNLEFRCTNNNTTAPCVDNPTALGEGNFRENSVSRILWDLFDDATTGNDSFDTDGNSSLDFTDTIELAFTELWAAFTHLRSSSLRFRNVGLFHEIRNSISNSSLSPTNYNALAAAELQRPNRTDYANPGTAGTCSPTLTNSGSDNQLKAHDFYELIHTGGALSLQLTWTADITQDLDLILYVEDYALNDSDSIVAFSAAENDDGSESISLSSLTAGTYLIDVNFFSGKGTATYTLTKGGTQLCPRTSF